MYKAAKAIIRYEDSFFLQLRDNNNSIPYPNKWAFFGGRLFVGEDPKTGLLREIKEELSYSLKELKEFYNWYNVETYTHVIFFLVELSRKISFKNINEGQSGKWFDRKSLDLIPIGPDVNAVKDLL
tara:strand:+ start:234 stop:611 length:378 start_codon:yes stop_codon:yes gene_type:complete